ncbi:MAG: serine/threonine-protein kinase [Isosphaeraceae bacterium]
MRPAPPARVAPGRDVRALLNDARLGGRSREGVLGRVDGYRLLKVLGVGAMGVAFLAQHPDRASEVCIKAMRPSLAGQSSAIRRFASEGAALRKVRHSSVVGLLDEGQLPGTTAALELPFFVTTLAKGEGLGNHVRRERRPGSTELSQIARSALRGLGAIHAAGLVHRDIKPSNLIYDSVNGQITIIDLGLAVPMRGRDECHSTYCISGTPAFMSPEQATGRDLDARSDLFSLGGLLYCLAAGRSPFASKSLLETMARLSHDTPVPIRTLRPDLSPEIVRLIDMLLEKDRDRRPGDAEAALDTLRPSQGCTMESLPRHQKPAQRGHAGSLPSKPHWHRSASILHVLRGRPRQPSVPNV